MRIEQKEAYVLDGRCAILKAKSQVPLVHSDGWKEGGNGISLYIRGLEREQFQKRLV